jgi:hypothetical protein
MKPMQEEQPQKITPELRDEWEQRLEKAGLPRMPKQEKVPIPPTATFSLREILKQFGLGMEAFLEEFKALEADNQNCIIDDLKTQRKESLAPVKIIERFRMLVPKFQEFERMSDVPLDVHYNKYKAGMEQLERMTSADSDETHVPKPSVEKQEAENEATQAVDALLKQLEEIAERARSKEKPKN